MSRARDIADLSSVSARLDTVGGTEGALSNRNVIINGAMQVAQRGTSSTGLGANTGSYQTVDRWKINTSSTAGRFTMTQDSSAPSGFANSTKFACTTADTSIAAGELFTFQQRIEGQDLQRFAKGTSDAKQFAVSFYVKGNANATYAVELIDQNNSYRHVNKTFNVTTDWTRVEIIFPADTTGTLNDDNNASLDLTFFLHAGSTYTSGTIQETWGALTQGNRAAGISSFFDSTSRTFFITGVQLEVGDTATDFEHRTFGDELAKCQRYYERLGGSGANGNYAGLAVGYSGSGGTGGPLYVKASPKRTNPTLTTTGTLRMISALTAGTFALSGDSYINTSGSGYFNTSSFSPSITAGHGIMVTANNDADAGLILDAEL
jgi:hypothetical protein